MWIVIVLIILLVIALILFLIGQVFYNICLNMKNDKQYITGPIIMDERTRKYENVFLRYNPKDVYLTNRQGLKLHGIAVDLHTHKWAVLAHGYMGRNGELVDVADFFSKKDTAFSRSRSALITRAKAMSSAWAAMKAKMWPTGSTISYRRIRTARSCCTGSRWELRQS